GLGRKNGFSAGVDAVFPGQHRAVHTRAAAVVMGYAFLARRGGHTSSAVSQQLVAVPVEPGARRGAIRSQALHQPPEARPVVHLGEMRHLMRHDIVDDVFRRQHQAPAEGETTPGRAAAPAALRVADGDAGNRLVDLRREQTSPSGQLLTRQADQMIPDPATEMSRVAAHPNLAVAYGDWWRLRVAFLPDPVRRPEHRHDRALDKRDRPRQGLEPGGNPAALRP